MRNRSLSLSEGTRHLVLAWSGASPAPRFRDAREVEVLLRPFLQGDGARQLRAFLAADAATPPLDRSADHDVLATAARLVQRGSLQLALATTTRLFARDGGPVDEADVASSPPPKAQTEQKTWIEIELVDMADQPIGGVRYVIEVTDGTTREGTLDRDGRARVDGIDPGQCKVTFPTLDQEAWEKA